MRISAVATQEEGTGRLEAHGRAITVTPIESETDILEIVFGSDDATGRRCNAAILYTTEKELREAISQGKSHAKVNKAVAGGSHALFAAGV